RPDGLRPGDGPARPAAPLLDAGLRVLPHGPRALRRPQGPLGRPRVPRPRGGLPVPLEGPRSRHHARLLRRAAPRSRSLDAMEASGVSRLNAVIHERARLGLMSVLAARQALTFAELKTPMDLTDGKLS